MEEETKNSVEAAQLIIAQERDRRAQDFIKEYNLLCEKHGCQIVQSGLTINVK